MRRMLPRDAGCFCPPVGIASPSSAPDSASAAFWPIRRTLSNNATGDPARIPRRLSADLGSTAVECSIPTGFTSSRTRRVAVVLPESGGSENSIAGVSWCTQNMWQRCAQNREFNPYFIAWGAQVAIIGEDLKVTSHLAKLLYDYKSYECDVDNDIRIIYGPILEKAKNGTSLEEAIRVAPPFGVKPEWW